MVLGSAFLISVFFETVFSFSPTKGAWSFGFFRGPLSDLFMSLHTVPTYLDSQIQVGGQRTQTGPKPDP